jgi:hypothetical protein
MRRAGKKKQMAWADRGATRRGRSLSLLAVFSVAGLLAAIVPAPARAQGQVPKAFIPDISERSGLLMRFASAPELLPPDPHRDFFYNTRYADNGRVKHPNWVCTQGLYGLGMKTPDTQSVYPYFYGVPGQSTIDSSSRPWFRPARFFQGLIHPFRPVGSYYAMGTYVPIYDLDPIAPGPGPYPYPFYFNWLHGG